MAATLAMAAAVDALYITIPQEILPNGCCKQKQQDYFCLSAYQQWAQPDPNDVLSATANNGGFGDIRSDNWPLINTTNWNVVGRVQGHHSFFADNTWSSSFNILFQDEKFKGSSLEVRGPWVPENPFEWAILGGTGQLTLAQGIVYGKTVIINDNYRVVELCINVFYRPIQRPN